MNCPRCRAVSFVRDSRSKRASVVRRRECRSCNHRWSTCETGINLERVLHGIKQRLKTLEAELTNMTDALNSFQRATWSARGKTKRRPITWRSMRRLSAEEKGTIDKLYSVLGPTVLAKRLGRSRSYLSTYARKKGLAAPQRGAVNAAVECN